MPRDIVPSLARLQLPPSPQASRFSYDGHVYRVVGRSSDWSLHRESDFADLATLVRTASGWAVVDPAYRTEWHDALHFLAIAAFLDDHRPAEDQGADI